MSAAVRSHSDRARSGDRSPPARAGSSRSRKSSSARQALPTPAHTAWSTTAAADRPAAGPQPAHGVVGVGVGAQRVGPERGTHPGDPGGVEQLAGRRARRGPRPPAQRGAAARPCAAAPPGRGSAGTARACPRWTCTLRRAVEVDQQVLAVRLAPPARRAPSTGAVSRRPCGDDAATTLPGEVGGRARGRSGAAGGLRARAPPTPVHAATHRPAGMIGGSAGTAAHHPRPGGPDGPHHRPHDPLTPAPAAAAAVGATFLLVGVLGFVPGIVSRLRRAGLRRPPLRRRAARHLPGLGPAQRRAPAVRPRRPGDGPARRRAPARYLLFGGGATYLVLWLFGLFTEDESGLNFVPVNAGGRLPAPRARPRHGRARPGHRRPPGRGRLSGSRARTGGDVRRMAAPSSGPAPAAPRRRLRSPRRPHRAVGRSSSGSGSCCSACSASASWSTSSLWVLIPKE